MIAGMEPLDPLTGAVADPINTPEGYRRYLLGALGNDDPAGVLAATPAEARTLVEKAGPRLRDRPAPGEWSVNECLGHLLDSELVVAGRARWIVSEDRPQVVGYDQALWVAGLDHQSDDPAAMLDLFEALRAANLELWAKTTPQQHARVGLHNERGEESYDLMFRLQAGHDRIHMDQARRALVAANGHLDSR